MRRINSIKMKTFKPLFILLSIMTLSNVVTSQEGLPPLIDREILFGNPEISSAQLSPDGKFISFIKPYNDVRNIWVKKTYEPFDSAIPITADTNRPIRGYFWSRDSKYVLYVQDKAGDENFHVYSVDPSATPIKETGVPESTNLTPLDGVRAYIMAVPKSDPDLMYIGLNDRDPSWHDLYAVSISTGERKLVMENKDELNGLTFDLNNELKLASKTGAGGETIIMKFNEDGSLEKCFECSMEETCYPVKFNKEGNVYFVSNSGDADLTEFGILDLTTNEFTKIESDPQSRVDFGSAAFSDITDELISTSYTADKKEIYWKDKGMATSYLKLQRQFPDAEISITSMTKDEMLWIVYVNSDIDPGAAYLYTRESNQAELLYRPRPNLPTEHLCKMTPVTYKSSDGMEIPAYLTLPKGVEAKNLPAIVFPHGGPWARDYWGYNSYAQFLANRGYAVLQPNFRSSTGFGKEFLNAGNNQWGELMQDDLTAGAEYLVEMGYADRNKIGIMGGSYGGYATLAGLTFTPGVYAAGVSIVGPSNLFTLLESIPPYWESGRVIFHKRMGDPNTEEGQAQLKRQSPFFHAKNITAPLLVAQGDNDPRVKTAESDQIVVAMRDLGLPVEYMNFPDEGHGFANPDNNIAFLSMAEKFLAKHLGGRYQEDMPENIQAIVDNVTVDISKVKLPTKITEEMAAAALPVPTKDVKVGEAEYDVNIEMGGQKMEMKMTRAIEDQGGNWKVTDIVSSPMIGEMIDETVVAKKTFLPVSKKANQGPMQMEISYSEKEITGTMSAQGSDKEIKSELDSPVFCDGSGLALVLSCLPLEKGYETIYRTFDSAKQKVQNYSIKVVGEETISAESGDVKCHKAEIETLGEGAKQYMWFDIDNPRMVKLEANLPEMGGAKMTITLK